MTNAKRFEIKLSADRRARLEALAGETGLSSADIARLAIDRLLADGVVQLPRHVGTGASAAAIYAAITTVPGEL